MDNNPTEPQDPPPAKPTDAPIPEHGEKPAEEAPGGEKEEEEAFLVSLYKFMKERHTPIERIPHLGFKQINLWKIYKAVEKLGAYELVTGRRLWKNVYDELGGSPGSTSAATCTRRHYERLVLPYVRHLKGEDDKPLPPSKPRKQYKVSRGTEAGEKSKRAKKEKGREQVPPDKAKVATGTEGVRDGPEQDRVAGGGSSPVVPTPSPPRGCPGPCRPHAETYKRLFSSFSSKGNPPIMSPLAKKKLLAQVSKAESSHCHKRHCPEGRRPASHASHGASPEPLRPPAGPHLQEQRSPEPPGAQDLARSVGSEGGPTEVGPGPRDPQPCPRAEEGAPAPAVFTGCFHAYRGEGLRPLGCPPLWGHFSSLKDFLEPTSTLASPPPEEPERPRAPPSKAGQPWSAESRRAAGKGCWVAPGAGFGPAVPRGKRGWEEEEEEEEEEEAAFGPRAVSPFGTEPDGRDRGAGSPAGLAKPKAVVATPGYPAPPPRAPDGYTGAMLRFPVSFGDPTEHLRTRGVPGTPSLSVNPFVIPAFPSPVVAASIQPSHPRRPLATGPGHCPAYGSSLRHHRLYPGGPWQCQAPYASPHVPAFHRHAKL